MDCIRWVLIPHLCDPQPIMNFYICHSGEEVSIIARSPQKCSLHCALTFSPLKSTSSLLFESGASQSYLFPYEVVHIEEKVGRHKPIHHPLLKKSLSMTADRSLVLVLGCSKPYALTSDSESCLIILW